MNQDISLDFYLWQNHKLHRGHIQFLIYYRANQELPKHKFLSDLVKSGTIYNGQITDLGLDILEVCETWSEVYDCKKKEKKPKKEFSFNFRSWWVEFPDTDSLDDEIGFRSLKKEKEKCSVLYENIIKEYSPEIILKCLKYEVAARKDQSKIRKENLMKYFSNSFFWLKNRKFEPYLKLIEKGEYKSKDQSTVTLTRETF